MQNNRDCVTENKKTIAALLKILQGTNPENIELQTRVKDYINIYIPYFIKNWTGYFIDMVDVGPKTYLKPILQNKTDDDNEKRFELIPVKFEGFSIISDSFKDLEGYIFVNNDITDPKLLVLIRCPGIREEQCNAAYITVKHVMKENCLYISVKIEPPKYDENYNPINPEALKRITIGKFKCEPPEMYTIFPYKTDDDLFKNVKIWCGDIYITYNLRYDAK